MKKLLTLILFAIIIIAGTGCLKDKGFDNHQYGINDPDTQPAGIGFPQGTGKSAINARSINSQTTSQTISDPVISLFATDAAPVDLHVNIIQNPTLITSYNTANGTAYVPFPAGSFTLSNLKITIPKGQRFGNLAITIPNASLLNPLATYAIAFSVASVDETGYTIADNLKDVLYTVSIKNKYDGIYSVVSGAVQRYTAPGVPTVGDALNGSVAGNPDLTLTTVGTNTVEVTNLRWSGGTSSIAGIDNLRITVDPVTNLVTMSSLGNATLGNQTGKVNKYDPATQTFTLSFIWNPSANVRTYDVIIKYKKPR